MNTNPNKITVEEASIQLMGALAQQQKLQQAAQIAMINQLATSADKKAIAKELYAKGFTQEQIAQQLGVTQSTISNWLSNP